MTTEIAAGRELDVLIATEVMGWAFCNCDIYDGVGDHRHVDDDWMALEPLPCFSTTYEGMGLVLERMRELGWGWDLLSDVDADRVSAPWRVEISTTGGKLVVVEEVSDTLPHAVCLAALKAVRA